MLGYRWFSLPRFHLDDEALGSSGLCERTRNTTNKEKNTSLPSVPLKKKTARFGY